ncbi:MAG: Mov34/MPN/PAD-1 family protein [Candidatus Odinarchaeota archaeon]
MYHSKEYHGQISINVPSKIIEYIENAAKTSSVERCGILAGFFTVHKFTVTHLVEDKQSKYSNSLGVTRTIEGIWSELNLIARDHSPSDYIGEWHTHAGGKPHPSMVDITTILSIIGSKHYGQPAELVLAIGTPTSGVYFWFFSEKDMVKMDINIV